MVMDPQTTSQQLFSDAAHCIRKRTK